MHLHAHSAPTGGGAAARSVWSRFHNLPARHVAAIVLAVWLASGTYFVSTEQQAVATTFGAIASDQVMAGVRWHWPWPAGAVHKLKVRELKRAFIGGEVADEANPLPADPVISQFLTGDQNILNVRAVAQYSVASPAEYLFRAREADQAVAHAVESALGRQISARSVDEVLTTEKVAIQEEVRRIAQDLVDSHGLGVVLSTVNIRFVSPPPEAADSFRDVASARADAARIVNEAEGYANDIIPRARGEGQQMLSASLGYRERKIQRAQGDATRFERLSAEHRRNPEVTESRLYLEAMEEVLPRLRKTVVDDRGNLDLTLIQRGQRR